MYIVTCNNIVYENIELLNIESSPISSRVFKSLLTISSGKLEFYDLMV